MKSQAASYARLPPRLRLQTKKGDAMRIKLLQTGAGIIGSQGYAALTFQSLSTSASASRGSIAHQFPTRLDLVTEVASYAAALSLEVVHARLVAEKVPIKRLNKYPDILWEIVNLPTSRALYEIQMAANWDSELAERIKPLTGQWYDQVDGLMLATAKEAGARNPSAFISQYRLLSAVARGVLFDLSTHSDKETLFSVLKTIRAQHRDFVSAQCARTRS